jgi:hypothetical protein
MLKWFPGWDKHALWCDPPRFAKIVKEGCWPLHPAGTWFLYRLASVGKSLQQRSAVSLLEDALSHHKADQVPEGQPWTLPAVALCSDTLVNELIGAESYGQQAAIAHAFIAVRQRYEHNLSPQEDRLLRAVLIASKVGLHVSDQTEANQALAMLAGTTPQETTRALQKLASDYGVIGWNDRFCQYEIIGDAVPRTAFDRWLREKASEIRPEQRAELFARHGQSWSPHLGEIKPAFGEERRIQTKEWRFDATCSCTQFIKQHLREAYNDWLQAMDVEAARGQVIYCYISPDEDIQSAQDSSRTTLAELAATNSHNWKILPIFAVFLHDKSGDMGDAIAEWSILKNSAGSPEVAQFSNFIAEHESQLLEVLKDEIADRIRDRFYACHSNVAIEGARLDAYGVSLFKALYPQAICFPFDGYQTVQGNAARDCRELTIASFQGIVTLDWIQARPPQMQNRARAILLETGWDIIGQDGNVQSLPRYREAAAIFRALQNALETNQGLVMGSEIRKFCSPPFGCNLASAGLLVGLFVSARREKLAFSLSGTDINPSNWISQAFGTRSLLQLEILDKTHVRLIQQTEADAWEKLLAEWEVALTHIDKVEWSKRASTLRDSVKVPGFLYDRYQRLEDRTQQAKAFLEEYEVKCHSLQQHYEDAYERGNAGNLSRSGDAFFKLHAKMLEDGAAWTPKQLKYVESTIEKCRQAVIQFFTSWLDKQDVLEIAKIGEFKHQMNLVKGNLQNLALADQQHMLGAHVDKISRGVDSRIKWGNCANEARFFVSSNNVTQNHGVAILQQVIVRAKEHIASLNEAYSHVRSQDLVELRSHVEALKSSAERYLRDHQNRAAKIENSQIKNIDDIDLLLGELRTLLGIFDGCQKDLNNFATYEKWLKRFDEDVKRLNDTSLGPSEFNRLAKSMAKNAKASQTDDDELPWDVEETYETLVTAMEAKHGKAAGEWIREHVPTKKNISALEPREAQRLKLFLQSFPAFLSKEQVKKVDDALNDCDARLDDLQVDGLVAKFESLSDPAKREFLKRAQNLMGKN